MKRIVLILAIASFLIFNSNIVFGQFSKQPATKGTGTTTTAAPIATSTSNPMYVACGVGDPPCTGSGGCTCTNDPYKCRTGTCTTGSSSICVTNQGPCPTATPITPSSTPTPTPAPTETPLPVPSPGTGCNPGYHPVSVTPSQCLYPRILVTNPITGAPLLCCEPNMMPPPDEEPLITPKPPGPITYKFK